MRRRYLLLLPVLAALAILCWASGASAHPCHGKTVERAAPLDIHAPAVQAAAQLADTDPPCRCCTTECRAQCAAATAAPAAFELNFYTGRHRLELVPAPASLGWRPAAAYDPPRPSA
jgi:hypothetical protein